MAIISKSGNVSHEGCVIESERKECRVMSDVYTDADYALLWNPEKQRTEWKRINVLYMGCDDHRQIIADINSGEYAEDYEIYLFLQEEEEKAWQKAKDEKMFKERLHRIAKGKTCRAVKGRKVPKGTEGIIFYIRGNRIGFSDENGTAHWINDNQIEIQYKEWGFAPKDSWEAEFKRLSR